MGIAEIEKEILKEAEAEADKIRRQAKGEASRIEAEAHHKANQLRQKMLAEAELKAEEVKTSILVPARLESKKKLLEEKHRLLESVFAGLPEKVREEREAEVIKILYG